MRIASSMPHFENKLYLFEAFAVMQVRWQNESRNSRTLLKPGVKPVASVKQPPRASWASLTKRFRIGNWVIEPRAVSRGGLSPKN